MSLVEEIPDLEPVDDRRALLVHSSRLEEVPRKIMA